VNRDMWGGVYMDWKPAQTDIDNPTG
jgi:hypothetical protein